MSEIENLLKATITEMERLLSSKTVIGEPIAAGENTVVPLLSVGAGVRGRGRVREGRRDGHRRRRWRIWHKARRSDRNREGFSPGGAGPERGRFHHRTAGG